MYMWEQGRNMDSCENTHQDEEKLMKSMWMAAHNLFYISARRNVGLDPFYPSGTD